MEEKNANAACPLTAAERRCKSHLSHAFFKIARLSLRQQEGMLHRAWETGINKKPPQLKAKRERGCSNKFKRTKLSRDGKEQARPSTSQTWGRNPYVLHLHFCSRLQQHVQKNQAESRQQRASETKHFSNMGGGTPVFCTCIFSSIGGRSWPLMFTPDGMKKRKCRMPTDRS